MPARIFDQESDKFAPLAREKLFIAKLRDYQFIVSTYYYDPRVVEKVKQVVPWEKLTRVASEKAMAVSSIGSTAQPQAANGSQNGAQCKPSVFSREIFIMELLNWFKNDFFSWFDHGTCPSPSCQRFGQPMSVKGSGQPTLDDILWGASRIELYHCKVCGNEERFPRYNHPLKLLDTRKGRCGEWANTMTCICTVFGYDSRLVLDFTDHVWTEIYSETQNRWIHADSCENGIDSPLVYETGWGKKLTYCIALSRYEIQDVTWRYVSNLTDTLARRTECSEVWLRKFILRVNEYLQRDLPAEERNLYQVRSARELTDLLHIPWKKKFSTASELQGRQSGSEAWRAARNEMGKLNLNTSEKFVFKVKDHDDFLHPAFEMRYNSVSDEYTVNGKSERIGWASGTYSASQVAKKVEHDWQMIYLARTEGSAPDSTGEITWLVDLQDFKWSRMSIVIEGLELEGTSLRLSILSIPADVEVPQSPGISVSSLNGHSKLDQRCTLVSKLDVNQENVFTRQDFPCDMSGVLIRATLSGGSGNMAWQKAQLFRQSMIQERSKSTLVFQLFR